MTGNKEITLYFCKILLYWQGRQETTQQSCVKDIKFILPQYLVLALSLAVAAEDKRQTVDARVVNLTFLSLWGTTGHRLNNGLCSRLLLPRSIVYQTTQSVYSATYHPQYWEQSSTLSLSCVVSTLEWSLEAILFPQHILIIRSWLLQQNGANQRFLFRYSVTYIVTENNKYKSAWIAFC